MRKITFIIFVLQIVVNFSSFGYAKEVLPPEIMPFSENGTISYGDRIYQFGTKDDLITYEYQGIENNSVNVFASSLWEGWQRSLRLPLNMRKTAFLKADNGEKLALRVIDKFGTIKVEKYHSTLGRPFLFIYLLIGLIWVINDFREPSNKRPAYTQKEGIHKYIHAVLFIFLWFAHAIKIFIKNKQKFDSPKIALTKTVTEIVNHLKGSKS